MTALSIDLMNSTESGSEFSLNSLLKSSRPERSSIVITLPPFPENEKLCVHSTLSHYTNRTASVRQSLNTSKLFISYGKPYKVISTSTLSRWLKNMLSIAGIDTSIFKGHSFTGASTSEAVSLGVSLADVLKAADRRNASGCSYDSVVMPDYVL